MEKAIKARILINVPGVTLERFRQHLPHSVVTALGHQDRQRHHKQPKQDATTDLDIVSSPPVSTNARTNVFSLPSGGTKSMVSMANSIRITLKISHPIHSRKYLRHDMLRVRFECHPGHTISQQN
jgi:hypothetical protein